jgi:hypothetical protein
VRCCKDLALYCPRVRSGDLSDGNFVFTLDETAGVVACCDVLETDVARCGAEERNSGANEDRYPRNDQALDEPGLKEPLDGDATVDIDMVDTAGCELKWNGGQESGQVLNHRRVWGRRKGTSAENENRLLAIGPRLKGQDRLVRLASNDQRIHRSHEFIVAMGFAAARREKVEAAIRPGDEAVKASPNKDGCFQSTVLLLPSNG